MEVFPWKKEELIKNFGRLDSLFEPTNFEVVCVCATIDLVFLKHFGSCKSCYDMESEKAGSYW